MCGIVGLWSKKGGVALAEQVQSMASAIRHRGPDDYGCWVGPQAAIANQRLSIIDLEGGNQPFISNDGQTVVVQNGEIFNYLELQKKLKRAGVTCKTNSDTEVILRMYETYGLDMAQHLNGMFAIAIVDRSLNKLFLIRDRAGIKPLFWQEDGEAIRFASEIKSILRCPVERIPDQFSIHQFLSFNYIPPPRTAFRGIQHVPPGHVAEIDNHGIKLRKWWDIEVADARLDQSPVWREEFLDLLEQSVRIRMRADVPFGAFLSGGVDSSSVVAMMARCSTEPIRSFCIGFTDKRFDESAFAQELADRVGAIHETSVVEANMLSLWPAVTYFNHQPHGDVSFMPTFRVSELASRHVKLVLTGDGGDELFAGYDKYRNFFGSLDSSEMNRETFERRYPRQLRLFSQELLGDLYAGSMRQFLSSTAEDQVHDLLSQCPSDDPINLALFIDFKWLLPGNNLVKPDRMAMANSLEARSPFLDYRMMEWAFSLPGAAKLRNGVTKDIMKASVKDLIGESLAYRKKQMFTVPIGEWLKERAHGLATTVLFDDRTVQRELFNESLIRKLLDEHRTGSANYTRELRSLLALELWFRIFIDQSSDSPPSWESLGLNYTATA